MKKQKGISPTTATILIILITMAAVAIIWTAIIPLINNESNKETYQIYLNGTEVDNITYQTVDSIEMIENGRYPDYLMCYSYCVNLGQAYNNTNITIGCNGECIQALGVDEVIYNRQEIYKPQLDKEWLIDNCAGAGCVCFYVICEDL